MFWKVNRIVGRDGRTREVIVNMKNVNAISSSNDLVLEYEHLKDTTYLDFGGEDGFYIKATMQQIDEALKNGTSL